MRYPNWKDFEAKYSENPQGAFESLCRMLFRRKYGKGDTLPYFYNNAGNETVPIEVGRDSVGFQAKFFSGETLNTAHIRQISHSIERAHVYYPQQNRIIVYSNLLFGNPPEGKKMTEHQNKVEETARKNTMSVEWILGENILDLVSEDELIYNLFFNLEVDLIHLGEHVNKTNELYLRNIKANISFTNGVINIDRTKSYNQLSEWLIERKHIIISGEGGSGKSAIIKKYYEEHQGDIPMIYLNAGRFSTNDVNSLFHLEKTYNIGQVRQFYERLSRKILFIDSAEKLLDINNKMPLMQLVDAFQEDGWNIVFTVKTSALGGLKDLAQNFLRLDTELLTIELLDNSELDKLLIDNKIEKPSDRNLYDRIHNLFYLARYIEIASAGSLSYRQYREQVWNQKIRGQHEYALQMQEAREQCLLELVLRQWNDGNYYISKENLDYVAVSSLMQDEILGSDCYYGYYFTHDLYADWAADFLVSQKRYCHSQINEFLLSLGNENTATNAFRRWMGEHLDSNDDKVFHFIEAVMKSEIEDKWTEPVISAVLRSSNSSHFFFKNYQQQLAADNYKWLNKVLHILLTSCQNIDSYITFQGKQFPVMRPVGSGWEAAIDYIFDHYKEYRQKNGQMLVKLLTAFSKKRDSLMTTDVKAGMMAIKPIHENAEIREKGESMWFQDEKAICRLVGMYASPLASDISKIIHKVVENQWVHYGQPYYELMTYLVDSKDINAMIPLCAMIPDEIIMLLDAFWNDVEEDDDRRHRPIPLYHEAEEVWGLNKHFLTMHNYFPSGARQTCLGLLLRYHRDKALPFIICFMNQAIIRWSECEWNHDKVVETTIALSNGSQRRIIGSQYTWNLYRGSGGNEPYLLQSIHMALEDYLLTASKEGHYDNVKVCLDEILEKSISNSLIAIVASLVVAYPDQYFDEVLAVCSSLQFLKWDLTRYLHEISIPMIDMAYIDNPEMMEERKTSNAMQHRKQHLETLLLSMQLSWNNTTNEDAKGKLQKVYELVDNLKSQLDKEPKEGRLTAKFIVSRLDLRSMKVEEVEINGVKGIQYTPSLDKEQIASHERTNRFSKKYMMGPSLKFWAEMRLDENYEKSKTSEYDKSPMKALEDCKKLVYVLENNSETRQIMIGDEFVPSLVGAALIKDYKHMLNKEQLDFCYENVLDALEDKKFLLSSSLSSYTHIMGVIGIMLDIKPENGERIKQILTSYSDIKYEVGSTRCCRIVAAAVSCCDLWIKHNTLMTDMIESFVSKHHGGKIESYTIEEAESLICMIAVDPKDKTLRTIAMTCLEKISRIWEKDNAGFNKYSGHKYVMGDVVARFIMSLPKELISVGMAWFTRYIIESKHDSLLMQFVIRAAVYKEYKAFWDVWDSIYDTIINKDYYYDHDILNIYMLNPIMYADWGNDWLKFEEKDIEFYNRIAHDLGGNPTVIKVMSKNCGTIARQYYMKVIPLLAFIVTNHPKMELKENCLVTINYLEDIMRRLVKEHLKEVKADGNLKEQVKALLDFMIRHDNSYASEIKKGL